MGEMSKKGWSNSLVFHNYMTKHFSKYVKLSEDKASVPTLVLFDGHKSHITLTLAEWARRYNIILFILPPHSSHVTQPLDVAVFGPFKAIYYSECQAYMKKYPGANITHYQIAELTHKKKPQKNKKKHSHFIKKKRKKKKKNTGTARASNGLDMLTWCPFHIYLYCT